ncbi:MAG: Rne/Rng family ribonuclease [Xanthobacteraceae bacterium]|jgi:ribonuclease E
MPNKMLVDATHPEETRVVVVRGQHVEEFDFESANRKQLRGNIYLAKVTRVEPSLQAAFVDYGGNRHGFLAFSEIHPDYYQIPIADRQALIAEEEREQRAAEAEADHRAASRHSAGARRRDQTRSARTNGENDSETLESEHAAEIVPERVPQETVPAETAEPGPESVIPETAEVAAETPLNLEALKQSSATEPLPGAEQFTQEVHSEQPSGMIEPRSADAQENGRASVSSENITEIAAADSEEEEAVESVGGADAMEEVPERTPRVRRQYKIQEVIKRRQVMLVQVVKEERGTKGAALTTYLSLAGRYSVLMPNTARGGGISRKITNVEDRRRLKEIAQELEVPEGMGVILRTAGAARSKSEVKRDFEYLLRMWETVRDLTLKSTAPKLVYEEGSLIKRSIRDLYNKDIDEILVAGEEAYDQAKEFMRMIMPSHVKNVKAYDAPLPVFTQYGIESQLDAMFSPVVQLRSGGYVVLNQAEALVAIDVNSGRATREHHIEDTALKTNLEAAEEIARQLRLRDLAGLIVIDFIDMDEKRNNRAVERRLKECLRHDRARIQVGHISHFGLLEMSRQRIRSSVLESSTEKCPNCGGTGHVRSVSSVALQLLRSIEEMLLKGATHNLTVRTRGDIALYLLNHKRAHLRALEERFRISILVNADPSIAGQVSFLIERGEQVHSLEQAKAVATQATSPAESHEAEDAEEQFEEEGLSEAADSEGPVPLQPGAVTEGAEEHAAEEAATERGEQPGNGRKRRRRRRGRRGGDSRERERAAGEPVSQHADEIAAAGQDGENMQPAGQAGDLEQPERVNGRGRARRHRGRRGNREQRREHIASPSAPESEEFNPEVVRQASAPEFHGASEPQQGEMPRILAAHSTERASEPARAEPHEPVEALGKPDSGEQVRRRSTVREPALAASQDQANTFAKPADGKPAEPIEPVISSSTESERTNRPPRSGWWSKRVFGRS